MRKVLLATTALVAMTGAASAEVAINGFYEFGYSSISDDLTTDQDGMWTDSEVHITFSDTSDNGLSWSAGFQFETDDTTSDTTMDQHQLTVSGDFGSVILGKVDGAGDRHMIYLPSGRNMPGAVGGLATVYDADGAAINATTYAHVYGTGDVAKATYMSPSMGGLSVGISYRQEDSNKGRSESDSGDNADTEMGISYSTDMAGASVTLAANTTSDGESAGVDQQGYGVSVGMGDFSIAANFSSKDDTTDTDSTGVGASYAISDSVTAYAQIITSEYGSAEELDSTSFGLDYSIAPGLSLSLAMNSFEYVDTGDSADNMDTDEVAVSIEISDLKQAIGFKFKVEFQLLDYRH
jgi:outer membrane protein OmpU